MAAREGGINRLIPPAYHSVCNLSSIPHVRSSDSNTATDDSPSDDPGAIPVPSECRSADVKPTGTTPKGNEVNDMAMKEKHVETKKEREEKRKEKKQARAERQMAREHPTN